MKACSLCGRIREDDDLCGEIGRAAAVRVVEDHQLPVHLLNRLLVRIGAAQVRACGVSARACTTVGNGRGWGGGEDAVAAAAVRDGTGRRWKQEVEMAAAAGVVN